MDAQNRTWLSRIFSGRKQWRPVSVLCWLVLTASLAIAAQRSLVVLPLTHALPEQILPAVEAVLPEQATVTAYNNQLILQVTPEEQQLVEQLLQQIDKAPRQLRISVRTPRSLGTESEEISVSGTFANGRVQIGNNSRPGRVVIRSDSASGTRTGEQSVRAIEGMPAYISTGSSVPVTTIRTDGNGRREQVTQYQAADRGFYVTARVTGDQVRLDIRHTDDSHGSQVINTRHLTTSVVGSLGQWITIGRTGTTENKSGKGLVARSADSRTGAGSVELLVEAL